MLIQSLVVVIKRVGYSLVELLVVLGIITLLAVVGIPNLFGNNERYALDNTARKVEQMIIDARTRSIAPPSNANTGYAQIYQVTFADFPVGATSNGQVTAAGDIRTNTATLQKGIASCGSGVSEAGVSNLKTLSFPRNIFVSSFYPTNQSTTETESTIRFSVGKIGYQCGSTSAPFDSTNFTSPYWSGKTATINRTTSRYLVIEISSKKVGEKRYVAVDRLNSEVIVSRTNPQAGFDPITDTFAPVWTGNSSTFNLVCRAETSEISFSFPRAVDLATSTENVSTADRNRLVFYDIHWAQGGNNYQPLLSKYFNSLTEDVVTLQFNTNAINISNQPTPINFRIWAFDGFNNYSVVQEHTFARPTNWDCGSSSGGGGCTTLLPGQNVTYRTVRYEDLFDLDENPCTSDTSEAPGGSGGSTGYGQMILGEEL